MISIRRLPRVSPSPGYCWPKTGNDTTQNVYNTFGPRRYAHHLTTVGYDYDFHRGCDFALAAGDPVYSVIAGPLTRVVRTHFGWERAEQLTYWTETDASSAATFARIAPSTLRITGSRVGAQTFPNCARYEPTDQWFDPNQNRWGVRIKFTSDPVLTGGVIGMGIWDPATNQYISIEYDGATVTARGVGSGGAFAESGSTASAVPTYLDLYYTSTDDTLRWRYSDVETSFTNIATKTGVAALLTNKNRSCWRPVIYWRSTDTNAAAQTIDIDRFGWFDLQTVSKFGNWTQINGLNDKVYQLHFQDIVVERGQIVESGQLLGYAGDTGFDETAGPNVTVHAHVEYSSINNFFYNDYDGQNLMKAGLLPRINVSNNVTATVTNANDPDGVACHLLTVTIQRANEDFDANEFQLVGNTTSRTVNFNTSVGIHPTNWRIPKHDGVYITVDPFNDESATQVLRFYFSKAVVGNTLVSAYVKDCNGTTLWSG